jgi:hypothetical protein
MGTTVKGTTQKGVRLTHTPTSLPSNAPAEPGEGSGPGSFGGGGENVKGSAGNAVPSNMKGSGGDSGASAGRSGGASGRGPESFTP